MRRAGHIRERSPGAFELRYSLGTDPATGKRKIATATVRGSRKDAEKELRRLLHALDRGEHLDPNRMIVRDWLVTWLEAVRQEVSPKTWERYSELVEGFLAPALGNLHLAKLAPVHIQAAYNEWATGGRRDGKPGGLSPQTRRHIHRVLTGALNRAVGQLLIARNPASVLSRQLPKVERKEMTTLSAQQASRLLEAIRHNRIHWPVLLALATGARRGEILALRWRHVDLDRGFVQIVQSLEETKSGLRFKRPKNERGRAVVLPGFAISELRRHKLEQAEELLALGIRQDQDTLLCRRADPFNSDGGLDRVAAMTGHAVGREYRRVYRRLNGLDIPYVRYHDLRHSHATQLLVAGIHPKVVQERLGHSNIGITLDTYSHVIGTMQEDAATRLDVAFGSRSDSKPPAG
jgi:integrase